MWEVIVWDVMLSAEGNVRWCFEVMDKGGVEVESWRVVEVETLEDVSWSEGEWEYDERLVVLDEGEVGPIGGER
jgi:hypothetical protein